MDPRQLTIDWTAEWWNAYVARAGVVGAVLLSDDDDDE